MVEEMEARRKSTTKQFLVSHTPISSYTPPAVAFFARPLSLRREGGKFGLGSSSALPLPSWPLLIRRRETM